MALKARFDWLLELWISFAVHLRATRAWKYGNLCKNKWVIIILMCYIILLFKYIRWIFPSSRLGNYPPHTTTSVKSCWLLHLGVYAMIGQFLWVYLTVRPAKFKSLFESKSSPSIWTQRYEKYLSNHFIFVCTVNKETSSDLSVARMLQAWAVNPSRNNSVRKLQCKTQTRFSKRYRKKQPILRAGGPDSSRLTSIETLLVEKLDLHRQHGLERN